MAHGPSLGARRPRGKLRAETPVNRRSPPFYLPARDPGAAPAARKQDGNSETPAGFLGFCRRFDASGLAGPAAQTDSYQSGRSSRAVKLGKLSTINLDERLHVMSLGVIL